VLSSEGRLSVIVTYIMYDMVRRPCLMSGHGNAILGTSSIDSACRIYEKIQAIDLTGKCVIATSYQPTLAYVKSEDVDEGATEELR